MEIIGKVVQLGTLIEGNSPRGPWKKQELIIETLEQFPKKVCLMCWGDRVNDATASLSARLSRRRFVSNHANLMANGTPMSRHSALNSTSQ